MTRDEFRNAVAHSSKSDLLAMLFAMQDVLILKHHALSSIYGGIEHEDDDFMQRLTKVAVDGLNAGTRECHNKAVDLPEHLTFVGGLENLLK
jgi:hypothetical protein